LRWFVHMQLRLLSAPVQNNGIAVEGVVRSRGRPEGTWIEIVKQQDVVTQNC